MLFRSHREGLYQIDLLNGSKNRVTDREYCCLLYTSTIIMVDSNLQRESLLPSERAFAYKMKLEAMKRQAGRPSKENGSQLGNDFGKKSSELLAEQVGQSKNQIFRYIRLTELIPELLNMVDEKKIAVNPAYRCV